MPKTKEGQQEECQHEEQYPVAFFNDGIDDERYLVFECSECNAYLVLTGKAIKVQE